MHAAAIYERSEKERVQEERWRKVETMRSMGRQVIWGKEVGGEWSNGREPGLLFFFNKTTIVNDEEQGMYSRKIKS